MKKNFAPIAFAVLVLFCLVYILSTVLPAITSADPIEVQSVEKFEYSLSRSVHGIALRDEVTVKASEMPYSLDGLVAEGARVAQGDAVVSYSTRSLSAQDRIAIDLLDQQISVLSDSLSATSQYDLKTLNDKVQESVRSYLDVCESRDLSAASEATSPLRENFILRNINVQNNRSYFEQIKKNCENAKDAILQGKSAVQKRVYASVAGYFTTEFDGYEQYAASKYANADPQTLHTLLESEPAPRSDTYVGKLQHYSFWNYLCLIPETDLEFYPKNSSWRVRFSADGEELFTTTMTVSSVSDPENGEAVLTLTGSFFDMDVFRLRICDAELIEKTYSGFRVRKQALRVASGVSGVPDGTNGVYILSGAKVTFKPVSVIYSDPEGDFAVVVPAADQTSDRCLRVNDALIIGGKEIYDKRIVTIT